MEITENQEVNSKKDRGFLIWILLAVVIVAQIISVAYVFATQKTAFHEDEYFSFGYANAYFRPFMYEGTPEGFKEDYWLTGDDFKYYIRTNKDTAFSISSVWYNQKNNLHPPFYHLMLHLISSCFPDEFSWWWGLSLNFVTFAITQIYLFLLFSRLCKSKLAGLIVCIFWGFSLAGFNTLIFIRMYSMLTMFCVMFVYYSSRLFMKEKVQIKKDLIPIVIVTFLGAFTQYEFLIFAFFFTLLMCLYFLVRKRFFNMFAYGLSALTGVLISFALFPSAIRHLFATGSGSTSTGSSTYFLDYPIQLHLIIRLLVSETTGYTMSVYRNNIGNYIFAVAVCLVVFSIPIIFLLRDKIHPLDKLKKFGNWFLNFCKNADFSVLIMALSSVFTILLIVSKFNYNAFGEYADRYIFMLAPFIIGAVIFVLYKLITLIPKRIIKNTALGLLSLCLTIMLVVQNFYGPKDRYIFKADTDNGRVNTYVDNADCIMVIQRPVFYGCYPTIMENANDIYFTTIWDRNYEQQEEEYNKLFGKDDVVYLLIDVSEIATIEEETEQAKMKEENDRQTDISESTTNVSDFIQQANENADQITESEILEYFEEFSGYSAEYCTTESTHVCTVHLYKLTKSK